MINTLTILHIELHDVLQDTTGSMELGHHGERPGGVDSIRAPGAIEICVAQSVGIDVATISVCWGNVTVTILGDALRVAIANVETFFGARMRGESCRHGIGIPQIHLRTA